MYDKFFSHLKRLGVKKAPALLAVSGGVDSIVLVDLFAQTKLPFAIAHAHFSLRAEASDADQNFVKNIARQHGVDFYTKRFETRKYAEKHKISIQMAARELRYDWFRTLMAEKGVGNIITAHHGGDQIETLLWHMVKGSGVAGFAGISAATNEIIRPLLWARKEEILSYAKSHNLVWQEDSSNKDLKYMRNYIRHEVVPKLKVLNPNLEHTVERTTRRVAEVHSFWKRYSNELKKKYWQKGGNKVRISVQELLKKNYAAALIYDWLHPFGFHWDMITRWVDDPPQKGRYLEHDNYRLYSEESMWVLTWQKSINESYPSYALSEKMKNFSFCKGLLSMKKIKPSEFFLEKDSKIGTVDYDKLIFPLTLRPWQKGDFFYPLGLSHRQKVGDFLMHQKVACHDKKGVYVVLSSEEIIWIVGYRIDDRYKIRESTQQAYRFSFEKTHFLF